MSEEKRRLRLLVIARPKTGKTSAVAALANAGFRIILCDFDGNADPLYNLIDEDKRHLLHVIPFEDKLGTKMIASTDKVAVESIGDPKAFFRFLRFLDGKPCRKSDGTMSAFGPAESWGPNTVLVVDSLTAAGRAAFRRYLKAIGRTEQTKRIKDWGVAANELEGALEQLTSSYYRCHVIVMAHVKMIGPKPMEEEDSTGKRQSNIDYNNEIKAEQRELVPTRLYPVSIGATLCEHLAEHFPGVVRADISETGRRIFDLTPTPAMDTGIPASVEWLKKNKTLPIETGLMDIMTAVTGFKEAPQLEEKVSEGIV